LEIKRGDVLALKTTGEIVYVLGEPYGSDTGQKVDIRRPRLSENGISHEVNVVFVDELETIQEYVNREAEMATFKLEAQKNILEKKMRELEEKDKKKLAGGISLVN
jgi:glutamyl-tRNA reductase